MTPLGHDTSRVLTAHLLAQETTAPLFNAQSKQPRMHNSQMDHDGRSFHGILSFTSVHHRYCRQRRCCEQGGVEGDHGPLLARPRGCQDMQCNAMMPGCCCSADVALVGGSGCTWTTVLRTWA